MTIGDDGEEDEFAQELKETVKVAMDRLKWSQKLASHDDDDERGWSLRQLTPTWVDGHELEPSSIAAGAFDARGRRPRGGPQVVRGAALELGQAAEPPPHGREVRPGPQGGVGAEQGVVSV